MKICEEKWKEYDNIVKKNIKNIDEFYSSYNFKKWKDSGEEDLIKSGINEIYDDPDNMVQINIERNNSKFTLSADGLCSWKKLYCFHSGENWSYDYEIIRKREGVLFWPRHSIPTINTLRRSVFDDRVDFTLFDISRFYYYKEKFPEEFQNKIKNCKLHKAYLNPKGNTYDWLLCFDNFKEFIDFMEYNRFVDGEYNVINLSEHNSIITNDSAYCLTNITYLENLKRILKSKCNSIPI